MRVKPGESDYTITVIVRGHSTNVYPRRSTSMPFLFRKLRFFSSFLLVKWEKIKKSILKNVITMVVLFLGYTLFLKTFPFHFFNS